MMPMLTLTSRSEERSRSRHQARIGVGQEGGLVDDALADRAQVAERRPVAHAAQELAMLGEERLRLVAQREQRFLGAEPLARLDEGEHLVGRHRVGARLAGILPERAVAAVVAAERRQGHEDLGREGDAAAAAPVAQPPPRRRAARAGARPACPGEPPPPPRRARGPRRPARAPARPRLSPRTPWETRPGVTLIMMPRSRAGPWRGTGGTCRRGDRRRGRSAARR